MFLGVFTIDIQFLSTRIIILRSQKTCQEDDIEFLFLLKVNNSWLNISIILKKKETLNIYLECQLDNLYLYYENK